LGRGRGNYPGGGHITGLLKHKAALVALGLVLAACSHQPAPVADRMGQPAMRGKANVYIVQRGDTLYSIAFGAGLDYRNVARWNRIGAPYRIYPGQRLRLAAPQNRRPPPTRPTSRPPGPSAKVRSWVWPARGRIIQNFAPHRQKTGIDISGSGGQGVLAAAAGRVVYAGSGLRGYGKLIIVKHNEVFLSAYAHNRKLLVTEGGWVAAGQRIAEMGNTGTNQVKLHFEIRRDGRPVDPLRYLPKR